MIMYSCLIHYILLLQDTVDIREEYDEDAERKRKGVMCNPHFLDDLYSFVFYKR